VRFVALETLGMEHFEGIGEARFMFMDFRDALEREWQLGTVQWITTCRSGLIWSTWQKMARKRPVMIHRAPLGHWND